MTTTRANVTDAQQDRQSGDGLGLGSSPWRQALRTLGRDRTAMVGAVVLLLLIVAAVAAPLLTPYDPIKPLDIVALKNLPPSLSHPLGTDRFSRDVLARLMYGARVSLAIAFLSVLVAVTVGTAFGAIAGYVGGLTDALLMRVVDACLAIPRVLVLIAIATLWYPITVKGLVLILGLTGWFGVSRLVRTLVVSAREDDFVAAARALGARDSRVLLHHILPRVMAPVLVAATFAVGNVIVVEAGLTFLGMGIQLPAPSWGGVFYDGMEVFASSVWAALFASIVLVVTVLAVNLVADGLRRALNARQLPAR